MVTDKNHKTALSALWKGEALLLISGATRSPATLSTLSLYYWDLLREVQADSCSEEDSPAFQETLKLLQLIPALTAAR